MCGIFGLLAREVDHERVERALGTLADRGPDGHRIWRSEDDRVALGHAHLSIVGKGDNAQPLRNERGTIVASVNGEFYGYETIRRELEKGGHRFSTRSDSEIVVHLYEEYGVECLAHLRGEFAFVLWDANNGTVFAARDRFGVKPLVWSVHHGDVIVSSRARAILEYTDHRRWDRSALLAAVHHQYAPPDRTMFDGIHTLRPGHYLIANRSAQKTASYLSFDHEPPTTHSFRAALQSAVEDRLQGDERVACYLSGGIDSSVVTAVAAAAQPNLDAFGVVFDDPRFDEERFARQVAEHVGANFHPIRVGPVDVFEAFPDAVWHAEGLAINAHLSAKYLLSAAVKSVGYKVVLSGEGADEILLGYPHLRQDLGGKVSDVVAKNVVSSGVMIAEHAAPIPEIAAALGFTPAFVRAKYDLGERISAHTRCDVFHDVDGLGGDAILRGFDVADFVGRPNVETSALLWTRLALANYILTTLGDGTEMAHSIEGRTPFLDERVVAAAATMSVEQKFAGGIEKAPLRSAVRDLLPEAIVSRPKQPFIAPPFCFDAASEPYVRELLRHLATSQFWNASKLESTWERVRSADRNEQQKWEPVLMTAFSAHHLEAAHNLEPL